MELLDKYIIARWKYAIGYDDNISDIEYKCIEKKLKEQGVQSEYFDRVWSLDPCPLELLEKYDMMYLYRDIKFTHASESIESLDSFTVIEQKLGNLSERSRVSFKKDGFNIQVNYYNGKKISAETRGRTGNALNANIILDIVPDTIPISSGCAKVTGELVIPNNLWPRYQMMTGNTVQRSSVSTALANGDLEYLQFVAFSIQRDNGSIEGDIYEVLTSYGFKVPIHMYVNNYTQLLRVIKILGMRKEKALYPSDGLVIENSHIQYALRVGEWEEETMKSYVIGYSESRGMFNNPIKIIIRPIKSHIGSTIREISVSNLQGIIDNNLQIGSPVAFDLRSAADCVVNTTLTAELQSEWLNKYDSYKSMIDTKFADVPVK